MKDTALLYIHNIDTVLEGGGDLDICGEELSTMRHLKKGRAGVKLRGWPEIGPDGGVLLMPYVPCGITGIDDDEMNVRTFILLY